MKRTRLLNLKDMFRQLLCHRQFTDGITLMNKPCYNQLTSVIFTQSSGPLSDANFSLNLILHTQLSFSVYCSLLGTSFIPCSFLVLWTKYPRDHHYFLLLQNAASQQLHQLISIRFRRQHTIYSGYSMRIPNDLAFSIDIT